VTPAAPSTAARALMFVGVALAMVGNYYVYDSIGPVAEMLSRLRGFSDAQIGTLNAVYSLPNIVMVLVGGVLTDRFGARVVIIGTTLLCQVGAVLTALDSSFGVMVLGRLLFGIGAETMIVAIMVALAQWFSASYFAFALAANLSFGRIGSYLADRSPTFAADLYAQGWQDPLWLAAGFAALSLVGASLYLVVDRQAAARGVLAVAARSEKIVWAELLRFRREYWAIVALCVTFYSVIFPFRSTFAIKFFQEARGLTLEEAGVLNSYVFLAAAFATPLFGFLADRIGRHADLLVIGALPLPLSFLLLEIADRGLGLNLATVCLGLSFSLVPAVLWPAVARYVAPGQLGTAYGLMTVVQNLGLTVANVLVGALNDWSGASAAHPEGYAAMLLFFGLLSLAAFVSAVLLRASRRLAPRSA
jgi:MFS family permease